MHKKLLIICSRCYFRKMKCLGANKAWDHMVVGKWNLWVQKRQVRIQRGRQGVRTPPGKSQVIWVSIGNKQLDPPPLEKVGPPLENVGPPPWKMLDPSGTLKNDIFYLYRPFDFRKISWGLKKKKKKKKLSELFFCQTDLNPPPDENSWIRAWITCE